MRATPHPVPGGGRRAGWATAAVGTAAAVALFGGALAGCGGSSSKKTVAPSTSAPSSSAAPAATATTAGSAKLAVAPCTLLSSAEVSVLAGGAPGPGNELDQADNYKTCSWNVDTRAVRVAVVVPDAGTRGFVHGADSTSPVTVAGLGDAASYATRADGAELIANKGRFSISLSVDGPVGAGTQAAMTDDLRQVLARLGA